MDSDMYDIRLNQIGERIAEISKEQYLLENVPLCWARFAVLDVIMPELVLAMEDKNEFFLKKEVCLETIRTCLNTPWPACVLKEYGFMADGEVTRKALLEVGAEWILKDLAEEVGVLRESAGDYFCLNDYRDRKVFVYMFIKNRLAIAWENICKGEEDQGLNCKNL